MNKNIIFLIPSISGGGAERVIVDLSNMFAKNNYNVSIFCIYKKKIEEYKLDNNITVSYLNSKHIYHSAFKLLSILLKSKKSIVISSITPLNCIVSLFKIFIKKHSLILMQHEIPSWEFNQKGLITRSLPLLIRILYKYADSIVCVSKGLKNEMEDLLGKFSKHKIKHIYNLNSITNLKREKKSKFSDKKLLDKKLIKVLSVGRLDRSKDLTSLIKAFDLFRKEVDSTLTIIGSGPQKNKIIYLINNLKLQKHIKLIPFKKDIYSSYRESDIYVSSSVHESFGNTIVEAMYFGLHIVVTDCPYGPKEICQNGTYGYIAKASSYKDLYEKLLICYREDSLPNYDKNLKRFSEESIMKQFLDLPCFR